LGAVAGGGWWAWSSQAGDGLDTLGDDPTAKITDEQVQALVGRISKFMVVPDEKPSVVVIRDADSLAQQQPFYRGSKDGDVLVVYSSRAIIYDAKSNKLVNVGPINRNEATPVPSPDTVASGSAQLTPTPAGTPAEPEKVTVDVRNGTSTAGLAGQTATDLKKLTWVTVGKIGDAKGTFTKTVIVDLSAGKKPNALKALETKFGVTAVTELPKGEQTSTADILVIVGK
jgi:hypothetical protein